MSSRGKSVKFYTSEERRNRIKSAANKLGMDYEEFVMRAAIIADSHPDKFTKLSRTWNDRRKS